MAASFQLLQPLFEGPLDIVGDVHGEWLALQSLLARLGYTVDGVHPHGRRLIFVGDLCDRGEDSPSVLRFVEALVRDGLAQVALGNHELNLLQGGRTHGNHWFYGHGVDPKHPEHGACRTIPKSAQAGILEFLRTLPVALERPDLRVVHASWDDVAVAQVANLKGPIEWLQRAEDERVAQSELGLQLQQAAENARLKLGKTLYDPTIVWSVEAKALGAELAQYDSLLACANPLRLLTFGPEQVSSVPYFAGGKWRFASRTPWWRTYTGTPVLFGHYWRWWSSRARDTLGNGTPLLFPGPTADHMPAGASAFCVDFCAGGRFQERAEGKLTGFHTRLAALRWPERKLVFDGDPPSEAPA